MNQQEKMLIAAERMRLKREKEQREENEFYQRITTGWQWLLFKIVVGLCTAMVVVSTTEVLVDGPTKKISEQACKIDRDWEYTWHKVLDIEGCMFSPYIVDWSNRKESSLKMTYSPIFRSPKKLSFSAQLNETTTKEVVEMRQMSMFNWFPAFQLFLLIPLLTFIFKRQKPWFNFARIASMVIIFPGMLMVIFFTLL